MQWLHLHLYRDNTYTQNRFAEFEFARLESVMVHTSWTNVSASLGNNSLMYDTALFQTLTDGYYDLNALNKILKGLGFYKLLLADNSQKYELWKFASLTAWNTDDFIGASNKTSIVENATLLNKHISNMTFFNGIRLKISAFNEYSTQQNSNQITSSQDIEIPVTAPRGTQQWIYFNPPIIFNADVTNTLTVEGYTWNNEKIIWHPANEPILDFSFE